MIHDAEAPSPIAARTAGTSTEASPASCDAEPRAAQNDLYFPLGRKQHRTYRSHRVTLLRLKYVNDTLGVLNSPNNGILIGIGRRPVGLEKRRIDDCAKQKTAPLPAPLLVHQRVEPAHFDWRWRERPALALLAWEALARDPLARLRRIQVESIGTTINFRPAGYHQSRH
jgi:hypothetical protein